LAQADDDGSRSCSRAALRGQGKGRSIHRNRQMADYFQDGPGFVPALTTEEPIEAIDDMTLVMRGMPKWALEKKSQDASHYVPRVMSFDEQVEANEKALRDADMAQRRRQKLLASKQPVKSARPQLASARANSENPEEKRRETRRIRENCAEIRRLHGLRRAMETRNWRPFRQAQQEEVAARMATTPRMLDEEHVDTVQKNIKLAALDQNVRLARGVLRDSLEAKKEAERQEQQRVRRATLEQELQGLEELQDKLFRIPGIAGDSPRHPLPAENNRAAQPPSSVQWWDPATGPPDLPASPAPQAFADTRPPASTTPVPPPPPKAVLGPRRPPNASGRCYSSIAATKRAELRRQQQLMGTIPNDCR